MSRLLIRGRILTDQLRSVFQGAFSRWKPSRVRCFTAAGFIFVAVMVACGACSRRSDFGAFFVQEVTKCGGRVDTNAVLPKVQASWKVKDANENGFTAYVKGVPWSEVDALMRAAFGKRARSSPERVYGEADTGTGVTLHWIFINGRTEVICTRGEAP